MMGTGFFILAVIALAIIGLAVPESPQSVEFKRLAGQELDETIHKEKLFTKEEIKNLPLPLQKYFEHCGFIGKPKIYNIHVVYDDVNFIISPSKPSMKIKYQHYNFADRPERIAFIDAKMFGIPFQGIDKLIDGKGSMTGKIAKIFTVFDAKGHEMDKASLVTVLGESILIPTLFLQDFVKTEAISDTEVKVTMNYYGMEVSGKLTFNSAYEITSFTTEDRYMADDNGKYISEKWSAVAEDYYEVDGIRQLSKLNAVWHLAKGDLTYFEGKAIHIAYNEKNKK